MLRNDGSAAAVASVGVQEAVARRSSVHFLQLVGVDHGDAERPFAAEEVTFRAGLHALRGHPRTPSVFEVVAGEPATVIRLRSKHAALLVYGATESTRGQQPISDRWRTEATCAIRLVPILPGS